jgi:hypothetical protein
MLDSLTDERKQILSRLCSKYAPGEENIYKARLEKEKQFDAFVKRTAAGPTKKGAHGE